MKYKYVYMLQKKTQYIKLCYLLINIDIHNSNQKMLFQLIYMSNYLKF